MRCLRTAVLVVDSAAAAVEGKGGEALAKVGCSVAPLKDLKPLRPGIQLAFCIRDPEETSGFSRA